MTDLPESVIEEAALAWLRDLGWTVKHGPAIAPGELTAERTNYLQVSSTERLRQEQAEVLSQEWAAA